MTMNLNNVDLSTLTNDELLARIAQLEAAVAASKSETTSTLTAKVGKSGTICVYGLMKQHPVALHLGQWKRLAQIIEPMLKWAEETQIQPWLSAKGKDTCHSEEVLKNIPAFRMVVTAPSVQRVVETEPKPAAPKRPFDGVEFADNADNGLDNADNADNAGQVSDDIL